jgi:hypothetical protein
MPNFIKHVGQVNATGKKCVIVFRSLPNDSNNCLVVETESLPSLYHDTLIEAVESPSAQAEKDFYNYAGRSVFHDGVNMLQGLHQNNWLRKFPTEEITVKPTPDMGISLLDLNRQLSALDPDSKTTSGAINASPTEEPANAPGTLSDKQIAAQMRSQATFFRNEADRLLKEANDLDPNSGQKIAEVTEMPRQKRAYNRKK